MKKTTQQLFKLALDKLSYDDKKLTFGEYEIIRDYPNIIQKNGITIGIITKGQIYINSFWERLHFSRAVEANIRTITNFFQRHIDNLEEEKRVLKNQISDLENKLAAAVVDLSLNSENND